MFFMLNLSRGLKRKMKSFKEIRDQFLENLGPSTPVSVSGGKVLPNFGAGRVGKIRPKGGKTIADLVKGV